MYDPEANEVAPFEEFMGSHGGSAAGRVILRLGAVRVERAEGPIVGVRAMHDALRGWLTETGLELKPHAAEQSASTLRGQ